jgi:nucleoside-diphosphate-sugar epimerase/glycosyltransferase involved in cell wall biosynthesis
MPDTHSDIRAHIERLQGPIVVFGAGGFIGANLVRAILRVREDCYAVTHQQYVPRRLVDLPSKHLISADLTNVASLARAFDRFAFKTIFQLGAFGGYSWQQDVDLIYRTNTLGLVNLLEVASEKGFSSFVHAGSSSEYGLNSAGPEESAALIPNSHYAVSKVSAAYLVRYAGEVRKQPIINVRFYSVYGPYEENERLIPQLLGHGMRGSYPPLVDPTVSRDFVYVDDAVEAALLAATEGVRRRPGASVNVASGRKTTIRELALLMKSICDIKAEPSWSSMPNRSWDRTDWYGNPAQAAEILGWRPRTTLEEGLRKTLLWQREQRILPSTQTPIPLGTPTRISAVVACYKDARAIPIMHERLSAAFTQMNVDYEIIFVNDASPDNTDEVLAGIAARDNHVVAIEHSRNFGSQSAFLSGMQMSTGDAVVLLDGDLQDPPEIIPEFYQQWLRGYEVVYGRRVKRETKRLLALCYKAFYRVFRGVSYIPMPLDAGDFSLMDRKVVNELLALPETDQFLRGLRAWVGFRQTGVDYVRQERMFGQSTNSWRKNIWWAKKGIFSFSFVPLELLSYFAIGMTGISFLAGILQIISRLLNPDIPHGVTTIIVLILFFGGVQLLAVAIVGEYLMRMFEETKKRPRYIRKTIRHGQDHYRTAAEMEGFLKKYKP